MLKKCLPLLLLCTAPVFAKPVLTVYTYDSFAADWGPGPVVKKAFEADCNCELKLVALEDGVSLLNRLRMEGKNSKADVVLGLDNNLLDAASKTGLFAKSGVAADAVNVPGGWNNDTFVPFDYGYFAFVYDKNKLKNPPQSLKELVESDQNWRVIYQDPRTSTPGLGLLLWMQKVYGDDAPQAWQKLAKKTVTVTKGWSEAYGLFLKGESDLVLSYTTSPAYHILEEKKDNYAAANFSEGHYLQVEVAARTAASKQPELAQKFLQFMVSPAFQNAIPTGNWMYPVANATTLVVAVALAAFLALWWNAPQDDWVAVWQDSYLWHVVRFSFWQAFLSALLSVIPAIFLARALYRRRFPGRLALLRLCAMTLILPVLVAVFGILSVYGRQGWLATLCQSLGLEWTFSPYGLQGILLAHVFFNLPMASRLLLQALENIPGEQRQLAAQLGMRSWHFFRFVEWPWLRRQIPPVAALIFMLCFASFATVLSLGGGPQATTIELAIYQALSYDYDPARAAMLALLQMVCCLGLVLLSQRLSKAIAPGTTLLQGWRDPDDRLHSRICDTVLIVLALLLLLPPLLAVIVDGVNRQLPEVLAQPVLWQALWTSLRIALAAGVLCVVLTMMLLWSSRELRARQKMLAGQVLEMSGMLILAMPGIVLATGFFLLLNNTIGLPQSADGIVIFTNALMAIPYALKVLENPMRDITARYSMLCQSLGIEGWSRLKVVELRAPKRPLAQALAFACVLSIGDFGVVALFGNDDFRTLPFYLYQQIGSYRSQDGAVTALILLLLCFLLFTVIEKLPGRNVKTD